MKTKKEVRELIYEHLGKGAENNIKELTNFYYKLQGKYIELLERPQLKQGRGVWGNWPYSIEVYVYQIKRNELQFLGRGTGTKDHASHKGVENVGLDVIGEVFNVNYKYYLYKPSLLKKLNILIRHFDLRHTGKREKEEFTWWNP